MKSAKPFVKSLSKRQLLAEAEKLLRDRELPSLAELTQAVLESRKIYVVKIRRARREAERKVSIN